ncbi:MAG: N-6 DNA methylase [Sandaracinaceae bacterium]
MPEEGPMDALAAAAERRTERLDREARKRRGVVHTPAAIARFIARAVADAPGAVIDPACGPGVFLAACIEGHPTPRRAIGIDLDAEALDDAEAILAPLAGAGGWDLSLRRGNTLAAPLVEAGPLVIVGNPPWAGRTANAGAAYTEALLDDFRKDADGAPLGERKLGVLSDDYVRFLRWACEQLRRPEGGVLAMVTSSSFLDGPVHRGMRARLLEWFATVDVVDLGGSALIARTGCATRTSSGSGRG